jgi:hypothetical protein
MVVIIIIIIIIIINIQGWAIWPVPSPELQLLSTVYGNVHGNIVCQKY